MFVVPVSVAVVVVVVVDGDRDFCFLGKPNLSAGPVCAFTHHHVIVRLFCLCTCIDIHGLISTPCFSWFSTSFLVCDRPEQSLRCYSVCFLMRSQHYGFLFIVYRISGFLAGWLSVLNLHCKIIKTPKWWSPLIPAMVTVSRETPMW